MHSSQPSTTSGRTSLTARLAAGLAVALVIAGGIFALGRLAPSAGVAMVLTGGWFVLAAAALFVMTRSRPGLVLPSVVAYGTVAVLAGAVLGAPLLFDRTVNEDVAMVAAQEPMRPNAGSSAPRPRGPLALTSGTFVSRAHVGAGKATVVRLPNGKRALTLTNFRTDNGPDLRVYLVRGLNSDGKFRDSVDLGALKGNKGNQQYAVPAGINPADYDGVVIWCRAFGVNFTEARLT